MFCDVRRHFGSDSKEKPFLSLWVLWSVRTRSSDLKYVALSFYTIYLSTCVCIYIFIFNNLTKIPAHNIVSHSWVWKREKRQRSGIPDQRREIQSEVGGNNSPAERRRGWNPEVRGQARWRRKPVTSLTPLSFTVATPRVTSVNKQEGWMKVSCEHTHSYLDPDLLWHAENIFIIKPSITKKCFSRVWKQRMCFSFNNNIQQVIFVVTCISVNGFLTWIHWSLSVCVK